MTFRGWPQELHHHRSPSFRGKSGYLLTVELNELGDCFSLLKSVRVGGIDTCVFGVTEDRGSILAHSPCTWCYIVVWLTNQALVSQACK